MIRDAVLLDQLYKIRSRVARQRRLRKMGIGREKIFRTGTQIREIAAPAARDQDFLADALRAFEHQHTAAPLARFDGAHEPRSPGAQNDDIVWGIHAESD